MNTNTNVLREYAEGRIQHLYRGQCPDIVSGHDSRDPDCPVCAALTTAAAVPPASRHAENVALLADILNRRPAMNAGLVEAYVHWTQEVYDLMGSMAAEPANDDPLAATPKADPVHADKRPQLSDLFSEALAWGMTYGPEIPVQQWDELRESMVDQYTDRAMRAQAAPAAVAGLRSGWGFSVNRSDGRVWLAISTPHGASATMSAAEKTGNGDDTIVAQVLDYLADSLSAPAAVAGPSEFPHEQMDAIALARYKVVPSNASMFWSHAVAAGDGTQQLYVGREAECQNMARKFAGAFLDGAFEFHSIAAAPTTQAAPQPADDDEGMTREQWIEQAMRVYLIAGDAEDDARECAKALCGEQNWDPLQDDLADPYDAAMSDVEDRGPAPQPAVQQGDALLSLAEKHGRVLIERCRVGGITGPLRWGIEYGYDDEIASGSTLLAAIDAARSQAKEGA